MNLIASYRTFHPKPAEYTFFSIANGIFSRMDHKLGHKTSLNQFERIKIVSSIFPNYNSMKLESITGRIVGKHNHVETKQHVTEKSTGQ